MSIQDESGYTGYVPPPCEEEVQVVYADDDILVVAKPAGLLSVPGRFVKDSVLQRVMFEFPDARIVHRLDLDTSGLMVLALTQAAVSELGRQFRERLVEKIYTADVWGKPDDTSGEIDLPMRPDPDNRPRQQIDVEAGKFALTRYELIEVLQNNARLLLAPVTGRSHQLRLHLAAIGHPILGCDLYAHKAALEASDRLCLHATRLRLFHPVTSDPVRFESEPPWV